MIKIITDSTSDIDLEYAKELNIEVVPLKVIINGKEYKDRIDLQPDQFYDLLVNSDTLKRVINFEELQNINSDVIGWLYIPDTKIDEPILKGENNDTYLRTDLYMKANTAGNLFIDEINSRDFGDDNTIKSMILYFVKDIK